MSRAPKHRSQAMMRINMSAEHLLWVAKYSAVVGQSPIAFVSELVAEAIDNSQSYLAATLPATEAPADDNGGKS